MFVYVLPKLSRKSKQTDVIAASILLCPEALLLKGNEDTKEKGKKFHV